MMDLQQRFLVHRNKDKGKQPIGAQAMEIKMRDSVLPTSTSKVRRRPILQLTLSMLVLLIGPLQLSAQEVSFSRDVLPILSDRCFHCHGPDESTREADLRLDLEEEAKDSVIVAGDVEGSELWLRAGAEDADMPPADSHRKPLSIIEREIIRKWIEGGAKWGKHWAFEKVERPKLPAQMVKANKDIHPIDAFIGARLKEEGLEFSPKTDPTTLLRRLSLDLTGTIPKPEQLRAFADKPTDEAYKAELKRIFDSPHYAERMAIWWLDAARYSDSDGYQVDATRSNWPWRDWVIQQFQKNRRFDEFTLEQFAGDLLSDATEEQKMATCFHRNHMTNGEGGRDPEHSRVDYVIDRVNTTGTVWLGLTLGCVQCHSHKFDPISHSDYYSFSAFFNSIDEDGRAGEDAKPHLAYTSTMVKERVDAAQEYLNACREKEKISKAEVDKRFASWLEDFRDQASRDYSAWFIPRPTVSSTNGTEFTVEDDSTVQTMGPKPFHDDYRISFSLPQSVNRVTGWKLEILPHESHVDGRFSRDGNGEFTLTSVRVLARRKRSPAETQLELVLAKADLNNGSGPKRTFEEIYNGIDNTLNDDSRNGWTTDGEEKISPHTGVFELEHPWQVEPGDEFVILLRHGATHGKASIGRFRISLSHERGDTVRRVDGYSPIEALFKLKASEKVPAEIRGQLRSQFFMDQMVHQKIRDRVAEAQHQLDTFKGQQKPQNVMVLSEREEPRTTHILERGVWDAKGEVVQRGVIPSVLDWPADKVQTRMELAKWILDRDNPLTSRVIVNHLWQIMLGDGLVRTPGDFGLQGERPTHPELLDWLAVEFIENDWDVQHVLRLIATSQTYQQSSVTSAELLERDPKNRLLARASRFRLPAWMLRDNALAVSGLLNPAVGGPPVYPHQPPGVWSEITMGRHLYRKSVGPELYRRTVYSFWRRASAPAFLFDSAQRRVCEVGVRRTNTPLQALTLMNDLTILESSRALADSIIVGGKIKTDAGLNELALRILSRNLEDQELESLSLVVEKAHAYFHEHPEDAMRYVQVGQRTEPKPEQAVEVATWMTLSNLMLNLDEAINRE